MDLKRRVKAAKDIQRLKSTMTYREVDSDTVLALSIWEDDSQSGLISCGGILRSLP